MEHEQKYFTCALISASLPVCLLVSEESARGSQTLSGSHPETTVWINAYHGSRTRPDGIINALPNSITRLCRSVLCIFREVCRMIGGHDCNPRK